MTVLLPVLGAYVALGVLIALPFAVLVGRVEPSAKGGSLGFRLLILPGATLLWPVILLEVLRRSPARPPRVAAHVRAHRVVLAGMLLVLFAALGHALHRRAVHHDLTAEAP